MNKVIDIADFWQFQITFEKYGLLFFERISDSELFFWNNEINENDNKFFSKLFQKTFIKEKNTISLSDIDFQNISKNEENLFYEKYFEKQFSNYEIKSTFVDLFISKSIQLHANVTPHTATFRHYYKYVHIRLYKKNGKILLTMARICQRLVT